MYKYGYEKGMVTVDKSWDTGQTVIELPHQCDSWEIGDVENARLLIADLEEAIKVMEAKNAPVSD